MHKDSRIHFWAQTQDCEKRTTVILFESSNRVASTRCNGHPEDQLGMVLCVLERPKVRSNTTFPSFKIPFKCTVA